MLNLFHTRAFSWLGALALSVAAFAGNSPPVAPVITEPAFDGRVLNPADVHMETGPFSDPDAGDLHLCTDWEIWTVSPAQRVWVTACIGGIERVHTHLGDGVFEGSHAGRHELLAQTEYRLRIRHRDNSGVAATEWSAWSERLFSTGAASLIFPLELVDVATNPSPQWVDTTGAAIVLPASAPAGSLVLDDFSGELLLEIRAANGASNQVINPAALAEHIHPRVVLRAGQVAISLPESDLKVTSELGNQVVVYVPAVSVKPGEAAVFWIASDGSTYVGNESQIEPEFSTLARGAPVPWMVVQPGFKVEVVATGFQLPVNIAFIPNPGAAADAPVYYVTELYGTIKVVRRDGTVGDYATGLLNFNPTGNFPGSGEQGLTGIAVDPTNGDVYAGMLYSTNPADDNAPHYPKVVKFTSVDGGNTAATQTIILNMVGETMGQSHQISNFSFGPDGKLYVHVGDGFDAARGQDLNSFRGKLLRLNKNGTAPSDNPFYNAQVITARDYVYLYGLRNPFGGAWRASDSLHYTVENGPSVDRFSQGVRGRNYLYDGSDTSMLNFAIYNWIPATAPVNIAFVQASTFGGSGFPASRYDRAYISESGPTWATGQPGLGKRITEWILDASGGLVDGPRDVIVYNGSGKATAAGLAAGPDGLYFSDLYKDRDYQTPIDRGANILRVRYVGTADFSASARSGKRPLAVQFTDLSDVPNPTEWFWAFGDGVTSSERNPLHTYVNDGIYTVRLVVRGSAGTAVVQRDGYIRVGQFPKIAVIGGSIPPTPADQSVADFVASLGYEVTSFDDDRGARPTATQLAAEFDTVVVSSSVASANIAADFRTVAIPMIFWEQAILRTDREPLGDNGATVTGVTAIQVLNNTHPITQGLALGNVTVFGSGSNMSVGRGNIGPGVARLATRASASADSAILAAETGAALLGGAVAPARRVFLFFEDTSWLSGTEAAKQIFERSLAWATNFVPPCAADFDGDGFVTGVDYDLFVAAFEAGAAAADFDRDGFLTGVDFDLYVGAYETGCN